jgi:hypothetical protein
VPEAPFTTGTVHWIGTGLSTGSGLRMLADHAPHLVVWGRTADRAEACLTRLGLHGRAAARAYERATVAAELRPGDVLVSMLPAGEHAGLLQLCVERRAHFACSSYVSEAMRAEVPAAEAARLVVLAEAGLDPGLDHLFADALVARARAAVGEGGATAAFTSYCGGIPATANEFRYRFSWAPLGVLTALLAPARYVDGGATKAADPPWEATSPLVLHGEPFEVYPNRDSIPYIARYDVPPTWRLETFVRGTLRLDGWRRAWADVFAVLRAGDADRIAALAGDLAARHPTSGSDRDRVVLVVALTVRRDDGAAWSGEYLLDAVGDATETAMARCVSMPLAFGVGEILAGRTPAGLHQPVHGAENVERWFGFLTESGVPFRFDERLEEGR